MILLYTVRTLMDVAKSSFYTLQEKCDEGKLQMSYNLNPGDNFPHDN